MGKGNIVQLDLQLHCHVQNHFIVLTKVLLSWTMCALLATTALSALRLLQVLLTLIFYNFLLHILCLTNKETN